MTLYSAGPELQSLVLIVGLVFHTFELAKIGDVVQRKEQIAECLVNSKLLIYLIYKVQIVCVNVVTVNIAQFSIFLHYSSHDW